MANITPKDLNNILVWILDSVDINHAAIKWGVVITIKSPPSLETQSTACRTTISEIHQKLLALQSVINAHWCMTAEQKSVQHIAKPHSATGAGGINSNTSNANCGELDWVNECLDAVIEVTSGDSNKKIQIAECKGSASRKLHVMKQLKKIQKRLESIVAKSASLNATVSDQRLAQNGSIHKPPTESRGLQQDRAGPQGASLQNTDGEMNADGERQSKIGQTNQLKETKPKTMDKEVQTSTEEQDVTQNRQSKIAQTNQLKETKPKTLNKEVQTSTEDQDVTQNRRPKESDSDVPTFKRQIVKLKKTVDTLTEELNKFKRENDALNTRLSEVMSIQLKDNPNIADLGDPLRPTNIADKFNQLYDDEWTDGFQTLGQTGMSEKESIQKLFDIVKQCFVFCKKQADTQSSKVLKALIPFESEKSYNTRPNAPKTAADLDKPTRITLNALQRQTSVLSKETVINEYFDQDKSDATVQGLVPFTEKCVELCWYMVLQSPPVYLDACDHLKTGSIFNKDMFKFYSRTGKQLDFVVWPPIFLHKDGPILTKGVAQPIV